uniref:WAP domain-containing protein n=1 Tax=Gopherus evgoodei TaxID=1825980 RepID=A0A8C4VW56_9SAUR
MLQGETQEVKTCELLALNKSAPRERRFPRVLPGLVGSSSRASPGDSVTPPPPRESLPFCSEAGSFHPWEGQCWVQPRPKRGTCPPNLMKCLYTEPPLCLNDTSCQGRQKCCYNIRDTLPQAPLNPTEAFKVPVERLSFSVCGMLPIPVVEGCLACLSPCAQDSDCRGDTKCCPLGCGRTCLAPQKGESAALSDRAEPGPTEARLPWLTADQGRGICDMKGKARTHHRNTP